jgi:hypothetical protein
MGDEIVLDAQQWLREAEDHIRDVQKHVKHAAVSSTLSSSNTGVHLNITTLEEEDLCVQLSARGLCIVGHTFDDTSLEKINGEFYETIHALLDSCSLKYRESFSNELQMKLLELLQ